MRLERLITVAALCAFMVPAFADALLDGVSAIKRKDYSSAYKLLDPLARAGNPVAQVQLGLLHYHGRGVPENNKLALEWFDRAARQGNADAQFHLGNMYAYVSVDQQSQIDSERLAAQWYFEAARQGHAEAQYSLGILFLTGAGVTQSATEAMKWIERAAAQGHADAITYTRGRTK